MLGKDYERQDCSIARALEVIGERWTLLIVRDAIYGVRRFNDFQAHLDIPKAVLSDRLSGLVEDGILVRQPDPRHGGRHLYELTPAGRDLWPVLHALLTWGGRHRYPNSRVFWHAGCGASLDGASLDGASLDGADGATLDGSGRCPRCGVAPAPEDIMTGPRPGRAAPPQPREDPVALALREPHRLLDPVET